MALTGIVAIDDTNGSMTTRRVGARSRVAALMRYARREQRSGSRRSLRRRNRGRPIDIRRHWNSRDPYIRPVVGGQRCALFHPANVSIAAY
ncbi:hypothetical protein AC578_5283 [Pseudocercospora eumusae]|uniref:Uncharacterized protein n=1 Tax=Pseudocercospora eumusae TaxID=321146 RepID=A0A139GYQ4_9PEZI|nr:hypothetical protein AC578_5283 [Pseudocercospora eumusae]